MAAAPAGRTGGGYERGNSGDDDPHRFSSYQLDRLHMPEVYRAEQEDDDTDDHAHTRCGYRDYSPVDVDDSAIAPVKRGTDNITSTQHHYRGVQRIEGYYFASVHCRDPPRSTIICVPRSKKGMTIRLGYFSEPEAAAMAYDVFSVFNHHDSLVNHPKFLHIYVQFVPRRGIDRKGAPLPLTDDIVERIRHIGAGIIRAFYPNTNMNIYGAIHRASSSRQGAEYSQIEQTTRDRVSSFLANQQAPRNTIRALPSMPSSALNDLDFSSILIPRPPRPSTANYNSQPRRAGTSLRTRQGTSRDRRSRYDKLPYQDPARHPSTSSRRYAHTPSRKEDAYRVRSSSHHGQSNIDYPYDRNEHSQPYSNRRFRDPPRLPRFDDVYTMPGERPPLSKPSYDSSERAKAKPPVQYQNQKSLNELYLRAALADGLRSRYIDGEPRACNLQLQNAPVEGQENARAGASSQRSRPLLAAYGDADVSVGQDPLTRSAFNSNSIEEVAQYDLQNDLQYDPQSEQQCAPESPSGLDYFPLEMQHTHGNDVQNDDEQKTVPLRRRELRFINFFRSRTPSQGNASTASSSMKMQGSNNRAEDANDTSKLYGSEDSVNMQVIAEEPFNSNIPDLNLRPPS